MFLRLKTVSPSGTSLPYSAVHAVILMKCQKASSEQVMLLQHITSGARNAEA